jgi:hypothetical protein
MDGFVWADMTKFLFYFPHAGEGWHPDPNQRGQRPQAIGNWIPAFAGTTERQVIHSTSLSIGQSRIGREYSKSGAWQGACLVASVWITVDYRGPLI